MRKRLRNRTWPVFLVGLGSLLALLFLPGATALNRTDEVYRDIRKIQAAQQATQRSLAEIERRMFLISVAVREALLDTAPGAGSHYRSVMTEGRHAIERELSELKRQAGGLGAAQFVQLEAELQQYWASLESVFVWTPEERAARAMYFLREQQRPRRQSILAIARSISTLIDNSYQKQYEAVTSSQQEFRNDIERMVAIAFLIGVGIAGGSIFRISRLEGESDRAEAELRQLSTQLMHAQEAERKSISRELHDEVGQMLTGLRMQLAALDRSRHDDAAFGEHLGEAKRLSEQTMRAVRDLAVGLRPSVLDLGLAPALQWQARQFSKLTGIRVQVHVEGEVEDLPEQHRTCAYRVLQESLTNAARHSNAKLVTVQLRGEPGRLEMSVQDDGSGFDLGKKPSSGLGLVGMQERVRELGGTLKIEAQHGKGASLHVVLSVPKTS